MTLTKAKALGLECFFFMTTEARAKFLTGVEEATGRKTGTFEEVAPGSGRFVLLVGTVAPRPRPVVTVVE
jgi:hypothetical protein